MSTNGIQIWFGKIGLTQSNITYQPTLTCCTLGLVGRALWAREATHFSPPWVIVVWWLRLRAGGREKRIRTESKQSTAHYALQCTVLNHTVLHCTVLHCTTLHCTTLYCTVLHYTALHCTALYYITLHCNALYCTALHCTALYWYCIATSTRDQGNIME